jgi:hypothetical protein
MRLWSLSPALLDSKGLVACWRESLLALNVLQGKTVGYKNHPQLDRFKSQSNPVQMISSYLYTLLWESERRGYKFDGSKIPMRYREQNVPVTLGQIIYEYKFLGEKVSGRTGEWNYEDGSKFNRFQAAMATNLLMFYVVDGDIEYWEKVK